LVESEDIPVDADLGNRSSPSESRKRVKTSRKRKEGKKSRKARAARKSKRILRYDPTENFMVPKHEIISESEKEKLVKMYGPLDLFPKILVTDPIAERLGAKEGDVIRIHREEGFYYRYVVSERQF